MINRVKALGQMAARLGAIRDQAVSDLESVTQEIETLTARLEVLAQVAELFRALMDKLVLSYVKSIESVVTEGLRTIFQDQDLTFEAEVTSKRNKINIDFFIAEPGGVNGNIPIRGKPLENFGGGPTSVASFVLRVLALLRLKRWPLLLMDESFDAVSEHYISQTGQFLKLLAERTGIHVLLVTHKTAYTEHANIAYQGHGVVVDGERQLSLQRIRGAA